jgi:hemolysin activation/secretion protein
MQPGKLTATRPSAERIILKTKLIPYALLVLGQAAFAQQQPDAGSQMLQIQPAPRPQSIEPIIRVAPSPVAQPADDSGARIMVKTLHVTGAQVYSEAQLLALTRFTPDSLLSLADLRGMAANITSHYRNNGYFVAQAYLPAQDVHDGTVTIAVIEGHYGKITLNNQTNLSNGLAHSLLGGLKEGDLVASAPLENRLLLLSDVPGVKVNSTLVPGASVGDSDLIVNLTPGPRVSGEVDFDNAGNRYTGVYRVGGTLNLNNPLGRGDVASLRAMTTGSGLSYGRASYQMMFGKATIGAAYSYLEYELGEEFESLLAHGTAKIASLYGSYPLIRSRNNNMYAGLTYEDKTFQDKVDSTTPPQVTDKDAQVLTGSLYGSKRDRVGGGGINGYAINWSFGNIDINTPAALVIDSQTAETNGHFSKLGIRASRLQYVTDSVSLYGSINGQIASKNLDSSEKMELGGMYAVRAYPEGEAYADQGAVANLEARYLLPKAHNGYPGQMHLVGFVDAGRVTIHKNPWASGSNNRILSGAGIGYTWQEVNNFSLKTYYAAKLGNEDAISAPDKSGRFWIQLVKYF